MRVGPVFAPQGQMNFTGIPSEDGCESKKSGWNGSLTLSLDRGGKKDQTNRLQAHGSATALQSDSGPSRLETCARDRRGWHGAILQPVESRGQHAVCTADPCHWP